MLQKLSLKHDQDMRELAGGPHRLLARAQIVESSDGGTGSGSGPHGGSQETRTRARAGSTVAERQETVIQCFGVQGGGGLPSRGNTNNPAQGQGDQDIQRARGDQERGREPECWTKGSR